MKKLLIVLFHLLIAASPVFAADYYFSSSTGNDTTGDGSIGSPWQTIAKINSTSFSPGDSIYLKAGDTWTIGSGESGIDLDFDCTSGSPCTLTSYGSGAKPIIDASAQTGDGRGVSGATETPIYLYNGGSYFTVDGLDLRGPVNEYTVNGYGAGLDHFTLQNCDITGSGYDGESPVRVDGDYVYILDNYVYGGGNAFTDGIQVSGASGNEYGDHNIIRGNEIEDLAGMGGGARMVHCDDGLIEDNWIHGVPTSESYHWGVVFRDPLDADVVNVIQNNIVDLQESLLTGATDVRGFSTWNSTGDSGAYIKVFNNTFIGNGYGAGLRFENNSTGRGIAQNNIVYNFANIVNVSSSVATGGVVFSNFCTYGSGSVTGDVGDYVDNGNHQSGDPLLVDVSTPTADTDYEIQVGSPCIDNGATGDADLPTDDYAGTARSTIDIGAFEYAAESTAPVVNAGTDQGVAVTSASISGTYTIEDGRTVASCTWSNDRGGSGSLTASGGTITGTVTGLSSGANVITITLTDSEAEEGSDDLTVTYTPPAPSSATIKGCSTKGGFSG